MTTHPYATDFYVGRGPEAEYLGTVTRLDRSILTHPDLFMSLGTREYSADDFRRVAATAVTGRAAWPHSHPDSTGTPWSVAYDKGSVYVYHHGVEMAVLRCNHRRWQPAHIAHPEEYPNGPSDQDEFVPRKAAKFPTFPPATDTEG